MTRAWKEAYNSALEKLQALPECEETLEQVALLIRSDVEMLAQASIGDVAAARALIDIREKMIAFIAQLEDEARSLKAEGSLEKKHSTGIKAYKKAEG